MSVLEYKDANGVWHEIVTIKGDIGKTGLKGASVTGASLEDGILWLECVTYTEQGEVPFRIEVGNVKGDAGDPGVGVPSGGVAGQVLAKVSGDDYETTWVDQYTPGPGDKTDVRINGASIVVDGVAEIPTASANGYGLVKFFGSSFYLNANGFLLPTAATNPNIDGRYNGQMIMPGNLDYAVKAAMGDGKGAEWDATTKRNARERMGLKTVDALPSTLVDGDVYFVAV